MGLSYDWYLRLPTSLVTCFNDIEDAFLLRYFQPIAYHTFLMEFSQIHLEKNAKNKYFNLKIFKTLQRILEEDFPNQ